MDGKRIHLASIGGAEDLAALFEKPTDTGDAVDARLRVRVPVKAGPHVVTVAFLADPDAVEPARLQPYLRSSVDNFDWSGSPHLQSLTIAGPFHPSAARRTRPAGSEFSLVTRAAVSATTRAPGKFFPRWRAGRIGNRSATPTYRR